MIKVLFVCHGNICRSPMAEFLFIDYVNKLGLSEMFYAASAATSLEEIGNPVHYGTKKILNDLGIDCSKKRARRITVDDYKNFDFIIGMDAYNIKNMLRLYNDTENKIHLLLEYANLKRDISDPWYTHDFNATYEDVMLGIKGFVKYVLQREK